MAFPWFIDAIGFREDPANGNNYVGFKAPSSIAADLLWTLPSADGSSGQVLSTNGSAVLSWVTNGAPTAYNLTADTGLSVSAGSGTGALLVAATLAVNQAFTPTWTGLHTYNTNGIKFNFTNAGDTIFTSYLGANSQPSLQVIGDGSMFWGTGSATVDAALSRLAAGVLNVTSILSAATGFRVNNAATSGNVLRGNGTNFVSAVLDFADITGTTLTVSGAAPLLVMKSTSSTPAVYLRFDIGSAGSYDKAYIGIAGASNDLIAGTVAGDLALRDRANILFSADNGTTAHMKLATGGQLSILAGSSTTRGVIGSNLHVNVSDMATSGAAETDMGTYSYPANALSTNGDCAIIDAYGTTSSGTGTASLQFYIAGTSRITILGLSATVSPWRFLCRITRKTATQIGYVISGTVGLVATVASDTIAVSDLTANALDIKVTGTRGTSQTSTEYGFICDFISRGS